MGRRYLTDILNDSASLASMVADAWGDLSSEGEFRSIIEGWRSRFNND